jgi:hypothetical protein
MTDKFVWGDGDVAPVQPVYWLGPIGPLDDFGNSIDDQFVDGMTSHGGAWAIMTPECFRSAAGGTGGRLGLGLGQLYTQQPDGRWLKTEG